MRIRYAVGIALSLAMFASIGTGLSAQTTPMKKIAPPLKGPIEVGYMQLPGKRDDPAHRLGHAVAEALIAPWPASLVGILLDGDRRWAGKTHCVGAFSRFDGRPPEPGETTGGQDLPRVLVLQGTGGPAVTRDQYRDAVAATPGWRWTILGGTAGHWTDDPWPELCAADVVVSHAGLSCLAAIGAARKPAVVLPQPRPHDEQLATARALGSAGLALISRSWPAADRWRV